MFVSSRLRLGAALFVCAVNIYAAPLPPWRESAERAWRASPEVEAARARRDAVRLRAQAAAQPLYNPVLSMDTENADVDRRTIGLGLTLDLSGKRAARATAGHADARAAEAAYRLVKRDVATRWLKTWASMALNERMLGLGQQRLQAMQRFDSLASRQLSGGDISEPERDLAALALADAQMQQALLEGELASARAAQAALFGRDMTPPSWPASLPPGIEDDTTRAIGDLADVVHAAAVRDAALAAEEHARRQRRADPTVALTTGTVRAGAIRDRVIGISVSMPLPMRDTGRYQVDAARVDAAAADAELTAARYAARAAMTEHRTRYRSLRQAVLAVRNGRTSTFDERIRTLERLWQAGEMTTADYFVQLKQSLDTALAGIELERSTWLAFFDYLGASGRLTAEMDGALPPEKTP